MTTARTRVAVVFGGRSSEHSISCISADGVLRALDRTALDVIAIGISPSGHWFAMDPDRSYGIVDGELPVVPDLGDEAALSPDAKAITERFGRIDVVFPVLHGPWGEDGTIQGLLELGGIPYVGSGVLASAAGMDKITMKVLLEHAGLSVGRFVGITDRHWHADRQACLDEVAALGLPVFVKPARAGSSRGIAKVHTAEAVERAIEEARVHDPRVIVEAAVGGAREIECGVLAGDQGVLQASRCAEIIVGGDHEFYDFAAKYLEDSAELVVPAQLPVGVELEVQALAVRAFEALGCEGLARVDFFLDAEGALIVNEVNTMPGFTPISMYPRMWQASGVDYAELVETLISDALRRGTGLR